tara:strand:- start:8207 stop:9331 length:1125 start_codon:yes stop_codon:yes gene_type:complete
MRKSETNKYKLLGINFIVLCFLFILPAATLNGYRGLKKLIFLFTSKSVFEDPRSTYPIYKNKEVTKQVFAELNFLETEYKSFIGWRRKKTNQKYTNIKGNYYTRVSKGENIKNSTWFFGGSTIWGTGVGDSETIPSIFNEKTGFNVFNFGESGWVARQSVNQLLNLISDGNIPYRVIFYDGVNDVISRCRSDYRKIAIHAREKKIASAINNQRKPINYISEIILEPYLKIKNLYNRKILTSSYDCHISLEKSKNVATYLVNDWFSAFLISKAAEAKFYAILQPTIFDNESNFEYFNSEEKSLLPIYKLQYESVYPKIIEAIRTKCLIQKEFCNSFLNGTKWIPKDAKVFMDFCHLTKEGNTIIVDEIIKGISNK